MSTNYQVHHNALYLIFIHTHTHTHAHAYTHTHTHTNTLSCHLYSPCCDSGLSHFKRSEISANLMTCDSRQKTDREEKTNVNVCSNHRLAIFRVSQNEGCSSDTEWGSDSTVTLIHN